MYGFPEFGCYVIANKRGELLLDGQGEYFWCFDKKDAEKMLKMIRSIDENAAAGCRIVETTVQIPEDGIAPDEAKPIVIYPDLIKRQLGQKKIL